MELVNKIDEKELFAARSTADAAGNNIADTYAKKTEIPDVSDFVTQQELSTELNTKQDNLSTEQLYNIDNAVTSLAGVMTENKLTIEGGKITEYDGTPFAGQGGGEGGKTYEGVAPIIVDNDNNTISADTIDVNYQQIVHDDSLVHVSNNAQYALGVNTRLFEDRTLLYQSPTTGVSAANLSETSKNFEKIEVWVGIGNHPFEEGTTSDGFSIVQFPALATRSKIIYGFGGSSNAYLVETNCENLGTSLACNRVKVMAGSWNTTANMGGNTAFNSAAQNCIFKVIGIGRKGGV